MWTIDRVINELNKLSAADGLGRINVPVTINGRLTKTLGRVTFNRFDCAPTKIEFSKQLLECADDYSIIQVIKHEYVHYYLLVKTGYDHGHDYVFKQKCDEIGCVHSKTHNPVNSTAKYKYEIWCDDCNNKIGEFSRRCKTIDHIDSCRCGRCGSAHLRVIQNW